MIPGGRFDAAATRHRKAAVFISVLVAALVCCSSAAATLTSPHTFIGSIAKSGCSYSITTEWSGGTPSSGKLSGTVTCSASYVLMVSASWDGTEVDLEKVSGTLDGRKLGEKTLDKKLDVGELPTSSLEAFVEEAVPKMLTEAQSALLTSPLTLEGQIGRTGCKYSLETEWSGDEPKDGKLTGTVACTASYSVTLSASWEGTEVDLEKVSATLAGKSLGERTLDKKFEVSGIEPVNNIEGFVEGALPEMLAEAQSALLTSPLTLEGKVGNTGCTYTVKAEWKDHDLTSGELTGSVACGDAFSAELLGEWDSEEATINELTVTIADSEPQKFGIDKTFTLPDPGQLDLPDLVEDFAPQISAAATEKLSKVLIGFGDPANALESLLEEGPEALPQTILGHFNEICEAGTIESVLCKTGKKLESTKIGYDPIEEGDASEGGPCPPYSRNPASVPSDDVVVCVPTMVAGTFDAGEKNIIVIPGGALMAVGPASGILEPTLKTSGSVLLLGGAVGGLGLKIQAGGNVEVASSYVSILSSLQIQASGKVKIGEVNAEEVLGSLPELDSLVGSSFTPPANITAPAAVFGGDVEITAGQTTVTSGASLSSEGLGGPGGLSIGNGTAPATSHQPGGASDRFGGTHGGYGSYPDDWGVEPSDFGWQLLNPEVPGIPEEHPPAPSGRGPAYDNPLEPTQAGSGGAGLEDAETGHAGGGVIRIRSSALTVAGKISANGNGDYAPTGGGGGGSGAGGTVNIGTGTLSGAGKIEADGGGICGRECANGFEDGNGGGGMIAERYTSDSFTGTTTAFGGENRTPFNLEELYRANGGAGTIYLLQTPKAPAAPKYGGGGGEEEAEDAARSGAAQLAAPAPADAPGRDFERSAEHASACRAQHDKRRSERRSDRAVACAAKRTAPPRLSKLTLSPAEFAPDSSGTGATSATTSTTGTTIDFRDSAKAESTFRVLSPVAGLLKSRKCVPATSVAAKSRSKYKRCKALASKGEFTHHDRTGANSLHFSGRFSGGPLAVGAYVLQVTPRLKDLAGPTVSADFHVIAPKAKSSGGARKPETPPSSTSETSTPETPPSSTAEGTLIIDDHVNEPFPPTDGTPLHEESADKHVTLEIEGGARVYATNPDFAKITVNGESRMTVTPPATLPAAALKVEAGEIEVGAGSRIEVNGMGYAGAGMDEQFGNAPAGVLPAGFDTGGAHGGLGGVVTYYDSEPLSTYDSAADPTEAGGGGGGDPYDNNEAGSSGGGVLFVTANTLVLNGLLQANGQNSAGPTDEEPFDYRAGASTGAGGSIQVHAETLTGSGAIQANGGVSCVFKAELLDINGNVFYPCEEAGSDDDSGGGGRVLVVAPSASGFTGQITANGGLRGYEVGQNGSVAGP